MAKRRANGEGSLYKRKDGQWTAQYTDCTGRKRYLYGKTQQIVKNKLKEAIKQTDKGIAIEARHITFSNWLLEWLEIYIKPVVRPSTYAKYYFKGNMHIVPYFHRVLLKDVRVEMLQKLINEKLEKRLDNKPGGYSTSACKELKSIMQSALDKAMELGYIAFNPANKVTMPKVKHEEKKVFEIKEQEIFVSTVRKEMEKDFTYSILLLILFTGLRSGEALALCEDDINFEEKELYVRRTVGRVQVPEGGAPIMIREPKTAHGRRTIPLTDKLIELLKYHIEERNEMIEAMRKTWTARQGFNSDWIDQGYLFISNQGGISESSTLQLKLRRIIRIAGVTKVSLHGLRHICATMLLKKISP